MRAPGRRDVEEPQGRAPNRKDTDDHRSCGPRPGRSTMSLNRVEIVGRLTRDPTLRAVGTGAFLAEFTVAVEEAYRGEVRTEFIGCTAWEATAERVGEQMHKGDELYVLGRLEQREIETASGRKDSKTKVRAMLVSRLQVAHRAEDDKF